MNWLIELQHWLYQGMASGLRSAEQPVALPLMMASAALFGALHALMPGHGKGVLVSYHLGREGRVSEGLLTGVILALTHIGSAVVFVMLGVAVISRSLAAAGRAPAFETASAILVTATGAFLLLRALRPQHHSHDTDGRFLAFVTGLVPCPLTTFILTYAIAKHQLAAGFAAVAAMALGVIATLVTFAVGAVLARGRLLRFLARSEDWRLRAGRAAEVLGSAAVIVLGLAMLSR